MKLIHFACAASVTVAIASTAHAQEKPREDAQSLSAASGHAPEGALEIGLGLGVTQGFGDIGKKEPRSLSDLSASGVAFRLRTGYRLTPKLTLGVFGEFAAYDGGDEVEHNARVTSGAAGIQALVHLRPFNRVDPWFSVGTGWRGFWVHEKGIGTQSLQGMDLVRMELGVNSRLSNHFAITPVAAFAVTEFFGERAAGASDYTNIRDARMNVFALFGAEVAFDIGGKLRSGTQVALR